MGKVEQQDDAIHHRVAQGDQSVDAAQLKTIKHLRQYRHGTTLPLSRTQVLQNQVSAGGYVRTRRFPQDTLSRPTCPRRS